MSEPSGRELHDRVARFADSNPHVVGYSEPVDRRLDLDDLLPHLYALSGLPDAIPSVTGDYNRTWGGCLARRERAAGARPSHLRRSRHSRRIRARGAGVGELRRHGLIEAVDD